MQKSNVSVNVRRIEPFGLTFREALPVGAEVGSLMCGVVHDQNSQMAIFNGRPLCEVSEAEQLNTSSPTELDGKDSINVDSDPFYD